MSEDLSDVRVLVPTYAGQADAPSRRLSDQQVRALAGRALVDLHERLDAGALGLRFDALLMRCEFGDQHVTKALENSRFGEPDAAAAIERCDAELVTAATAAKSVTAAGLEAFIGNLERTFDERAAMIAARLKR